MERPSFNAGGTGPAKHPGIKGMMLFVKSSETLNPSSDNSEQTNNSQLPPTESPGMPSEPPSIMSSTPNSDFQNERSGGNNSSLADAGPSLEIDELTGIHSGVGASPGLPSSFKVPEAKPILSTGEYLQLLKNEKIVQLAKLRKLVYEVMVLKTVRPNAVDKIMSACNRVPIKVEFKTDQVKRLLEGRDYYSCHVFMDSMMVAFGEGTRLKDAKTNAFEAALQKLFMPHLRLVSLHPEGKELEASREEFTDEPSRSSTVPLAGNASKIAPSLCPKTKTSAPKKSASLNSQFKETNYDAATMKRRGPFDFKPLEDFLIIEPKIPIPDCTSVHTLRRSADFNHMLIEYEYSYGEAVRCVLKIENKVLASLNAPTKLEAKNMTADQTLSKLREICWTLKTKQAEDSDARIKKDEILNESDQSSDVIGNENVGHKLLSKMGWSGGGVGKDGSGIAEPVSMKSVLNREGLGLSAKKGITDEFLQSVTKVVEEYAASDNQEDLVFDCGFTNEERQIIHNMCRKLNLKSNSRGKGDKRYLCVTRKRTASELFKHIKASGGETLRYQLVPPAGGDVSDDKLPFSSSTNNPPPLMGSSGASPWHGSNERGSRKRRNSGSYDGPHGPKNGPFYGQRNMPHNQGPRNGPDRVQDFNPDAGRQWSNPYDSFERGQTGNMVGYPNLGRPGRNSDDNSMHLQHDFQEDNNHVNMQGFRGSANDTGGGRMRESSRAYPSNHQREMQGSFQRGRGPHAQARSHRGRGPHAQARLHGQNQGNWQEGDSRQGYLRGQQTDLNFHGPERGQVQNMGNFHQHDQNTERRFEGY